jgi:hypothetical protein
MCCGQGSGCDGSGELAVRAQRALIEAFNPRARYEASELATSARESRAAIAYWREAFDCGRAVLGRGGSTDEYLACQVTDRRRG